MSKIYGYCRISRKTQSIERQERNILALYPTAILFSEAFTGRKTEGRDKFNKLLSVVKAGDTIVFDSVSRMSRNATEGVELYFDLYNKGVNLVFLKESYINTDMYKSKLNVKLPTTDSEIANMYIKTTEQVLMLLAKEQIVIAFEQSQKEVDDLSQRTKEGLVTAKLNGKQVGNEKGVKLTTKKSVAAKEQIRKYSHVFEGTLKDDDVIKLIGISRNTFYKYKKEMLAELAAK